MEKLLFGISGIPLGNGKESFTYNTGIKYLKDFGLDAMELPFVKNVNVTDKNKGLILKAKEDNDFYLSAHGSYFINLNAEDEEKQTQSLERIIKGAKALKEVSGRSIVFHAGYYLSKTKEETYKTILNNLKILPNLGVDYRLETTGKRTQFGDLKELVDLCKEVKTCKVCIDFSHIHARYNGCLKSYDDFKDILVYLRDNLGEEALKDFHAHISGINYGLKGEKKHMEILESDFKYIDCMKALKDMDVKGCIICESPILEKDAILLKETYMNLQ